jgi:hypothetical protein
VINFLQEETREYSQKTKKIFHSLRSQFLRVPVFASTQNDYLHYTLLFCFKRGEEKVKDYELSSIFNQNDIFLTDIWCVFQAKFHCYVLCFIGSKRWENRAKAVISSLYLLPLWFHTKGTNSLPSRRTFIVSCGMTLLYTKCPQGSSRGTQTLLVNSRNGFRSER